MGTSSLSINYSTVSTESANGFAEDDTEAVAYYGINIGGMSNGVGYVSYTPLTLPTNREG